MPRAPRAPDISGMVVTFEQAAKVAGYTPGIINHYAKMGLIKQTPDGKITLGAAMQGIVTHLRQVRKGKTTLTAANKVAEAKAREIELRVAEREGEVMPTVEIDELFTTIFANLRLRLSSIPARVTRNADTRYLIETEINDALSNLSNSFAQEADRLRTLDVRQRAALKAKKAREQAELEANADLVL